MSNESQRMPAETLSPPPLSTSHAPVAPLSAPTSQPAPLYDAVTDAELLAPFVAPIEPVRVSAMYRLTLAVVALFMVLLPLVYVGLTAGTAWALYHYAPKDVGFWYIVAVICGSIGVLFMIKPLFAPRKKDAPPLTLTREDQPRLFAYVEALCRTVGAPMPRRIDVNAQVNASASLRRGVWSLFGSDLVLTIGLPLASGLNLRQLTGVLAHEFGHFAQGGGMRVTYVIRSVSGWFARVVYERDAWDRGLEAISEHAPHILIALVLYATRLFVWCTRKILWLLMHVGHAASCSMLRHMEYDADRYEARVAGSDDFAVTSRRIPLLNVANKSAHDRLGEAFREGRLGDDLIKMILASADKLESDEKVMKKLRELVDEEKTGWFDTHPATPDRIASAEREHAPGVFHLESPSTVLFRDYDRLCKAVTLRYYRDAIGPDFDAQKGLVPTDELLAEQAAIDEAHKTLFRFFRGQLLGCEQVFLPITRLHEPEDPRATAQRVKALRDQMMATVDDVKATLKRYDEADAKRRDATFAMALFDAEMRFQASMFGLKAEATGGKKFTRVDANRLKEEKDRECNECLAHVTAFRDAGIERLLGGLQLLSHPSITRKVPDSARLMDESNQLLATLAALQPVWKRVQDLREHFAVFGLLLNNLGGNEQHGPLIKSILARSDRICCLVKDLRLALSHNKYPFSHVRGVVTIGDYALHKPPTSKENVGEVFGAAEGTIDQLVTLYFRCMAHLAHAAEQVETALGLEPLPDPPKEDAEDEAKADQQRNT
ncbi:MAG: M48 family metalloprotease [Phycisphaera sp.]|nr:M48 family metalloprotease [Phycisphaera sp.]